MKTLTISSLKQTKDSIVMLNHDFLNVLYECCEANGGTGKISRNLGIYTASEWYYIHILRTRESSVSFDTPSILAMLFLISTCINDLKLKSCLRIEDSKILLRVHAKEARTIVEYLKEN
jgi:hypothetical protein